MNGLKCKRLINRITGFVGVATVASFVSLPALAQVNPRPSILTEPRYDGVPGTGTAPAIPAPTQGLAGTNPSPSVLTEPRYDGIPSSGSSTPSAPAPTSGLAETNPNPSILTEPRYDGVPNNTPDTNTNNAPTPQRRSQVTPAPSSPSTPGSSAALSTLDREFAMMAAQSNNAEIQTSQLALQRSRTESVRSYAQRMIQEHTQVNRTLTQFANQQGITLPTGVDPLNRAIAEQLAQLSGREFDQAYVDAQTNGHLQAVALFQTQIQRGQEPFLRDYATRLLPTIQDHLQVASQLSPNYSARDITPGMMHQNQIVH